MNKMQIVFLAFIWFALVGCEEVLCENKEIMRLTSPDERVDAVMNRQNCGATTPYVFEIFIVPKGGSINDKEPVFVADHLRNEEVQWKAPKFLEIQYEQGRIYQFTNFWQSRDVDDFRYVVEVRETPLTSSHSLSPDDRWVGEQYQ